MIFRGGILCIIVFFFVPLKAQAEVVMQVGNSTLRTGNATTTSPFMTNKKGDRIIKLFSHKKEQTNAPQEIAPVIQIYPQVDLTYPRPRKNSPTHHGVHRVK